MGALSDVCGADLGDKRLSRRLEKLVEGLLPSPSASFPDATKTDAALEATYRFFQNEEVSPEKILAPHIAATVRRAQQDGTVLVAHDTTEFSFSSYREGLGRINDGGRGFFGHFALAMRADGSRKPLGVVGLKPLVRGRKVTKGHHSERLPAAERESFRWTQLVQDVEGVMAGHAKAIHLMDSEADAFELVHDLTQAERRFVIRLKFNRSVANAPQPMRLEQKLQGLQGRFVREVQLSSRSPSRPPKGKRNVARCYREAKLAFSATRVPLLPPEHLKGKASPVDVHIVHVRELDAPEGTEPVDWKLVTTEPIDSVADIERIVDAYRARWVIEEFFKALKTGCAFEKRQLETLSALLNALAVFVPIAWELLLLRSVARDEQMASASDVLSTTKLLILQRHKTTRLATNASARDAFLAIARLGGHIKNNGEPGWQVLGRGYEKLLAYEQGAILALNM
jgi:transposase-like protein/DDE family transposase